MVKRISLLVGVILLTGCDTKLYNLSMDKTPYNGDELRIDGYYYSDLTEFDKYTGESHIRVAVFYRDGNCINTAIVAPANLDDILSYIENEILLNDAYIAKLKSTPTHIGVFQIIYPEITIEDWEGRSYPFKFLGEIVDNTTFIISEKVNNRTGTIFTLNTTYYFQEFSPLPDITNKYTKTFD